MMSGAFRALLFAVLVGLGAFVGAARAEVPPGGVATLAAAAARFEAAVRARPAGRDLPRWSRPDDAPLLAALWDERAILGAPPYRAADVPKLIEINGRQIEVYKAYLLFAPSAEARPDLDRNAGTYQDEIARSAAFMVATVAATLPALSDFASSLKPDDMTPVRRDGVRKVHLGITQIVTGFALLLRSPGFRPENRAIVIESFAVHADALAAGTARKDKAAMIAQLDATLSSLDPTERARIELFRAALLRGDCDAVCALE